MELNELKGDPTLEEDGTWVDLSSDSKVKVARMDNPRYQACVQRLMRPHRHMARAGDLGAEIVRKVSIDAMAETILLDWEGFTENGKSIKATLANRKRVLEQSAQLRNIIADISATDEYYRLRDQEEGRKN